MVMAINKDNFNKIVLDKKEKSEDADRLVDK